MKQLELKKLSLEELREKLQELQDSYAVMTRTHVVSPVENTASIRLMRRDLARVKTAINNQ